MSGMCLEGCWKVSERPIWTCLAPFGPGIYLLVSECCMYGGCLESACKVSGRMLEGVLLALIGGCLEGFYRVSGGCLEDV